MSCGDLIVAVGRPPFAAWIETGINVMQGKWRPLYFWKRSSVPINEDKLGHVTPQHIPIRIFGGIVDIFVISPRTNCHETIHAIIKMKLTKTDCARVLCSYRVRTAQETRTFQYCAINPWTLNHIHRDLQLYGTDGSVRHIVRFSFSAMML